MRFMPWKLQGVITALITPLTKESDICTKCLEEMIKFQLSKGISGLFIMGTYGEGILLSERLKKKILEKVIDIVPSKTIVLPHIGSSDIEVIASLARTARDLGYEAVSTVGPIYHVPTKKGLIKYFDYIAKEDVGIVIYNIKNRQRYNISPDDFELIVSEVPAVIGIKDTSYDVDQLLEYVERFGNKYFIAGAGDSMIYYTFSVGAHAHICGVSNAFPEVVVALYKAVVSGNHKEGQRYQFMINKLRRTLRKYGIELQEVFREVLKLRGIHSGYPPLQLSEGLTKDQLEELKKIVEPFIKMGAGISK